MQSLTVLLVDVYRVEDNISVVSSLDVVKVKVEGYPSDRYIGSVLHSCID